MPARSATILINSSTVRSLRGPARAGAVNTSVRREPPFTAHIEAPEPAAHARIEGRSDLTAVRAADAGGGVSYGSVTSPLWAIIGSQ